MPEETTLEEAIRRNASGPKSAEVDGQKVEQHSLADQIAADEYLASKKAVKSRTSGLKIKDLPLLRSPRPYHICGVWNGFHRLRIHRSDVSDDTQAV